MSGYMMAANGDQINIIYDYDIICHPLYKMVIKLRLII